MSESKDISCASRVQNGNSYIKLVIPSIMDSYYASQRSGNSNWEKQFELEVLTGFLHELDHLAYGNWIDNPSSKEFINEEKNAWALTCEHTIALLVEYYHFQLIRSDQIYYENWIKANRNVDDPIWDKFIKGLYEPKLEKRRKDDRNSRNDY
ncbi:hypothetical protein K8R66_03230 [bacterium]|nr:hypothetical protein [bacterium]